jgi:hypothetical protein
MLHALAKRLPATRASLFDLLVVCGVLVGGTIYHAQQRYWAISAVDDVPYGDAFFWWHGGVHIGEGNFADHPGKGFRAGYFLLTGLALPALGGDLYKHYAFLVTQFLGAAALLYLALRRPVGRLVAACGVALLVFNPFTAEWLATPTTDGTGLVLHLLALACLLVGIGPGLRPGWLAGFGILFALATLTRPLVTPYVGVVPVALLLANAPWRRRLAAAAVVLVAFFLPTFLWLAAQNAMLGEWSISTNDASALYAASDPAIQCWTPSMYQQVADSARQRFGVATPTPKQVNEEFWRLTQKNYLTHADYHLKRFLPQMWEVARFSPQMATHGNLCQQTTFLFALAAILAVGVLRRSWRHAVALLSVAGCLWLWPYTLAFLTCAGALLALLTRPGRDRNLGPFLLAGYWLAGVVGVFLTGGVSGLGAPGTLPPYLNALGYRTGSQFFFVGDLLAAFFLLQLATLNLEPAGEEDGALRLPLHRRLAAFFSAPAPAAATVLLAVAGLAVTADLGVAAIGVVSIARRWYEREKAPRTPFPDLAPVVKQYRQRLKGTKAVPLVYPAIKPLEVLTPRALARLEEPSMCLVVTGSGSEFLWNVPAEERSVMLLHQQDHARPAFRKGEQFSVEFPCHFPKGAWAGRQGAFLLRSFLIRDEGNLAPDMLNACPEVHGFVPLSADGSRFELDRVVWFPLVKSAALLHSGGDLHYRGGIAHFTHDGFRRRLEVMPEFPGGKPGTVVVSINLARALGKRRLSFDYQFPAQAGTPAALPGVRPKVQVVALMNGSGPHEKVLAQDEPPPGLARGHLDVDLTDKRIGAFEVRLSNLYPGLSACLDEVNLQASDFAVEARKK